MFSRRNQVLSGGGWLSLLAMLLVCASVSACPNCKEALANDPAQAGLVRGFFWSILFMVSMPFLLLGGLSSYFYWEICRARRAAATAATSPFAEESDFEPTSEVELPVEEHEPVAVS